MSHKKFNPKDADRGFSSLYSGETISKSSLRLEALGDLDELQAALGLARYHAAPKIKNKILSIQRLLFILGSEIATNPKELKILSDRLNKDHLKNLDSELDSLKSKIKMPQGFIIPGDHLQASYINLARSIARRLERRLVYLHEQKMIKNHVILAWINHLSIYLFYLMCSTNRQTKFNLRG